MSFPSTLTSKLARRSSTRRLFRAEDATGEPGESARTCIEALVQAPLDGTPLGLVAPGTVEGLCSAIAIAYLARRPHAPLRLHIAEACQPRLGEELIETVEDETLTRRLMAGFERVTSTTDAWRIIYLCQSDEPNRGQRLLDYVRYGFDHRDRLWNHRSQPAVAAAFDIAYAVSHECEHARQFVRFHKTSQGIYYARFEPKANVIPLVMRHFVARFNTQPFLIHDPRHHLAGVWDGIETQLVSTAGSAWEGPDGFDASAMADDRYYQALWKRFYDSIAIESRLNPELRRQFVPLRFWKNLPEMDPRLDEDGPLARSRNVATALTPDSATQKRPTPLPGEQGALADPYRLD